MRSSILYLGSTGVVDKNNVRKVEKLIDYVNLNVYKIAMVSQQLLDYFPILNLFVQQQQKKIISSETDVASHTICFSFLNIAIWLKYL